MKQISITIVVLLIYVGVVGQATFHDATKEILGSEKQYSTICIAVDDINGDRKDDLILLDESKYLKTFIQGGDDQLFDYTYHKQVSNFGSWAIITGDLNNDSQPEVIASGTENGSDILFLNDSLFETRQTTLNVYSQNTNLVDLNNDGYLDLFVCNDTGESLTYLNDGDGKMLATKLIDFKTSEEDDMSGNYSSVFADVDMDGDQDLYIGKCRAGVSDPTDRRRINTLYINNGDGTYSERAQEFGLANGAQTWSVDAGDVDNDGDIDFIIANHDRPHDLMLNDGNGFFTRFPALPDAAESYAYQSFFQDFDNNGWLDIFITEPANSYILYNDSMSFSMRDMKINGRRAFSGVTGDFNSDGFPDLYLGFATSFQMPSDKADIVLLNNTNHYNWLDINLEGEASNYDGIGSRVTIFYEGGQQMREVKAGQSYGVMNSTKVHFGLKEIDYLDSIKVEWPSGNVSVLRGVDNLNQHLVINENGCETTRYFLPDYELCDGQTIVVNVPEQFENVIWSDGSTGNSLSINKEGYYSVEFVEDGCLIESNVFKVNQEDELSASTVIDVQKTVICEDETIRLIASPSQNYLWNDGSTEMALEVDKSGMYQVTVTNNCGERVSNVVEVYTIENPVSEIEEDSVLFGQIARLYISGEDVKWYQYKNDVEHLGTNNFFYTSPIEGDTSFYAGNTISGDLFSATIMEDVPLNSASDSIYTQNDTLDFEIHQEVLIKSIKVRTQRSGKRQIEVYKNTNRIWKEVVEFDDGVTKVNIDLLLGTGEYYITTNQDTNLIYLESENPLFSFSEFYNESDKVEDNFFEIKNARHYESVTPYFFDWDVSYGFYTCESRYKVNAYLKDPVSTVDEVISIQVYPNPSNGSIVIESDLKMPYNVSIFDMKGRLMNKKIVKNRSDNQLALSLVPGNYIMQIQSENRLVHEKLVIF